MKHVEHQPHTTEDLCKFLNRLHRIVWTVVAAGIAAGALFFNPGHLVTAALVLLWSRAEWTPSDINALR